MQTLYERILLTLDGSELAQQAIPQAQYLAEQFGSQLFVIQVVPDIAAQLLRYATEPMLVNMDAYTVEQQAELTAQVKAEMQEVVASLQEHGINATAAVEVGDAASTIIDFAAKHQIDVIVMSTHGRTGFARWVYGSVANKVLQEAPCPVLLVRAMES